LARAFPSRTARHAAGRVRLRRAGALGALIVSSRGWRGPRKVLWLRRTLRRGGSQLAPGQVHIAQSTNSAWAMLRSGDAAGEGTVAEGALSAGRLPLGCRERLLLPEEKVALRQVLHAEALHHGEDLRAVVHRVRDHVRDRAAERL